MFQFARRLSNPHSTPQTRGLTPTPRSSLSHSQTDHERFLATSGETDPVWVHTLPYSCHPSFPSLNRNTNAQVAVIGSGIAGIQTAYELVKRGHTVILLEARHILSGETGRTSGHLSNALDDGFVQIRNKHGPHGAMVAAESHGWAIARVGEISSRLGIECELRYLPAYKVSKTPKGQKGHDAEIAALKKEVRAAQQAGVDVEYCPDLTIKGWDGDVDQRDGAVYHTQATFHPTKYLTGVLEWLRSQPNFSCYADTRVVGIEQSHGRRLLFTDRGYTVGAQDVVEATCIPLQKSSVIAEMGYYRTYCIAIRVPKGSVEDCLIYDTDDPYKYTRLTACDDSDDYIVAGGCDHKVGQETTAGRFYELETWVRERFKTAGRVDYRWSGQIVEPVDYMAFIGKNPGRDRTYIVTGDSGNGLTHGILAGKLIADEIDHTKNPWSALYNPKRLSSIGKSLAGMLKHDAPINAQYKRWLQSDVRDIEDIVPGGGGVLDLHGKPVAVYKDTDGNAHRMSAVCPHMKGVVCWNETEKSWDCPVHGSRFSCEGMCVEGPSKGGLAALAAS